MRTIKLNKLDELYYLVEELKAVIYLRMLLIEESNQCSFCGFEETVGFADYYLLQKAYELIIKLNELISSKDFTQKV